jgi:hypothetical protein
MKFIEESKESTKQKLKQLVWTGKHPFSIIVGISEGFFLFLIHLN